MVTKIGHNSEDLITVNGYQAPNFYVRQIEYDADLPELTAIIERASTCTQGLSYKCRNSRLFASAERMLTPTPRKKSINKLKNHNYLLKTCKRC